MGSLRVDYPDAIELVSETLDEQTLKDCLRLIVQFLGSIGVQSVSVEYGFNLERDRKGEPQLPDRFVPLAELEGVVEGGLDEGEIECNGTSDFVFAAVGAEFRCMICNDSDLHLASVDRTLVRELARLLSTLGVTIYDEGDPVEAR